jgi:hypothetical protein
VATGCEACADPAASAASSFETAAADDGEDGDDGDLADPGAEAEEAGAFAAAAEDGPAPGEPQAVSAPPRATAAARAASDIRFKGFPLGTGRTGP